MNPAVLLVEPEVRQRQEMGGWLEDEGFDVLTCPGPLAPAYTCLASRAQPCPLERVADVVVLDMRQASDDAFRGTPGWELLMYYMEHGDPVVALSGTEDAVRPLSDTSVAVLRRPVDRKSLIGAVRRLSRRSTTGGAHGHDSPH